MRRLGNDIQLAQVVPNERRLEHQVLGWIAGDRQLGKANHVGARGAGAPDPVDDQAGVAGQVADRRVDLRERDPHVLNFDR